MKSLASGMAIVLLLALGGPLASAAFAGAIEPADGRVRIIQASLTAGTVQEAHEAEDKIARHDRKLRIRTLLCGTLDLSVLGPFVLGEHWAKASESERQSFMEAFADTIVEHSLIIFRAYKGETFDIVAVVPDGKGSRLIAVEVNIRQSSGPLLAAVGGRLRNDWGDFKIVDIVGGGVSTALTLRKEYQAVIEKSGGKVDGLIEKLRKSVASTGAGNNAGMGCLSAQPL